VSNTTKGLSERDFQQTLKHSYNDIDGSLTTAGFLTGKVGRKVTQTISTTTVSNDTLTFTFSESGIDLYAIKVIYSDATYTTLLSAERTS
jgi:hypothetical protein